MCQNYSIEYDHEIVDDLFDIPFHLYENTKNQVNHFDEPIYQPPPINHSDEMNDFVLSPSEYHQLPPSVIQVIHYVVWICRSEERIQFTHQKKKSSITKGRMHDTCLFLYRFSTAVLPPQLKQLAPLQIEIGKIYESLQAAFIFTENPLPLPQKRKGVGLNQYNEGGKVLFNSDSSIMSPTDVLLQHMGEVLFLCHVSRPVSTADDMNQIDQKHLFSTYVYFDQMINTDFPYFFEGYFESHQLLISLTIALKGALKKEGTAQLIKSANLHV